MNASQATFVAGGPLVDSHGRVWIARQQAKIATQDSDEVEPRLMTGHVPSEAEIEAMSDADYAAYVQPVKLLLGYEYVLQTLDVAEAGAIRAKNQALKLATQGTPAPKPHSAREYTVSTTVFPTSGSSKLKTTNSYEMFREGYGLTNSQSSQVTPDGVEKFGGLQKPLAIFPSYDTRIFVAEAYIYNSPYSSIAALGDASNFGSPNRLVGLRRA